MRYAALALVALSACGEPWNDRELTGVQVAPAPGEREGPVTLRVRNRLDEAVSCALWEDPQCPSLSSFADAILTLEPDELVEQDAVNCAYVDIVCNLVSDPEASQPLRVWGWSITPPIDDA